MPVPEPPPSAPPRRRWLAAVGPGLLVAATGVGAGDLATAALTGSRLGVAVLWAVLLGAAIKLLLNEGLARFQLASGETLIEGVLGPAPAWLRRLFLGYFLLWSFLVAAALVSACGAATLALVPLTGDPLVDKRIYGLAGSAAAYALVRWGGYRRFERAMGVAVAVMVATAAASASRLHPAAAEIWSGLVPRVPAGGVGWTLALMGGVGGTVTVLAYGYWIREDGREGPEALALCRLDLAAGYAVTALFGVAMVVLGSQVAVEGSGVRLLVGLGQLLDARLGPAWRFLFLAGAWSAVYSSVLGVWQSVPYLFADLLRVGRRRADRPAAVSAADPAYRRYLLAIATVPCLGLWSGFAGMQKLYATVGALFMPMLTLALLVANRRRRIGALGDGPWVTSALLGILVFFAVLAGMGVE